MWGCLVGIEGLLVNLSFLVCQSGSEMHAWHLLILGFGVSTHISCVMHV